ncbi:MAG: MFS transporter, partial [Candidatus Poseidoniaceae archaeon]
VGLLSWTPWITVLVVCAHASSGANWVLSTVMLQERTEDDWRGRVFATDFLLMTTANGTSSLVAALLITYGDVTLRQLVLAFAMVQVVSGILWVLITRKGEREYYLASTAQVRTPI